MAVTRSCNFHAQAIRHIRHLLSTEWHRHWSAVWSWRDWTIATRYSIRRSSQKHPEVAACAEQCSQNRPPGTDAVPCQPADASTTLAAGSTQNWLQGVYMLTYEIWTRLYRSTSANASTAASTHGHCARRLRHCSSNRSLVPTSRNVLFDVPRRLSGTHFPRLSSEASQATHCIQI